MLFSHLIAASLVCSVTPFSPVEIHPYNLPDSYIGRVLDQYHTSPEHYTDYVDSSDYNDYITRTFRQPIDVYGANEQSDIMSPDLATLDETDSLASLKNNRLAQIDADIQQQDPPSIRDIEFLQHSSLWGNQWMTGGAGEGRQFLGPVGNIDNVQLPKTDSILPAYCEPPNPCPAGLKGSDGCLEIFENSASFSRQYQASQRCMCDTDHMFNCADSTDNSIISALARSLANKGVSGADVEDAQWRIIEGGSGGDSRVVAKKYHSSQLQQTVDNPYLEGPVLPVAAKKGVINH